MHTMVIIDDEPVIRNGIRTIIEQGTKQFRLVGEAPDGVQGLHLLLCMEPEVAIVDVKMLKMDGLKMIEQYHHDSPVGETRFIILSAHDDYLFTRKAIRSAVIDYLLKPVNRFELLHLLESLFPAGEESSDQPSVGTPKDYAQQAIAYVNAHFFEDISLTSVADAIGKSPNYLASLFRKATGKSYLAYVTCLRVEKAKALLTRSRKKVYEVGRLVGYFDPKHFSKVFRRATGMSPEQYRAEALHRSENDTE